MPRRNAIIDRATLLTEIYRINDRGMASAKRIAEELNIPQQDAIALAADEVADGYLFAETATKTRFSFTWYQLTERGREVVAAALRIA
jgi:DNA-binding PadR family transcriptional regulator